MPSNVTVSKSDLAIITALFLCATATWIESHNRIQIDAPDRVEDTAPEVVEEPSGQQAFIRTDFGETTVAPQQPTSP